MTQSNNLFVSEERADSAVEYAVLISMLVSAVFLGGEIFDRSTTVLGQELAAHASIANPAPANQASDAQPVSQPQKPIDRLITLAQLAAAGAFVVVAAGFVARNVIRRWTTPKDNDSHSLIQMPDESEKENLLYVKRQELFRNLAGEDFVGSLQNFSVDRLMTTHITSVGPRTPAVQIRLLMTGKQIHHVLVCAIDGTVMGVISDRDILAKQGDTASDVMTADPVCVTPEAAVLPTVTIMLERRISCLPVIEGEKVVGMITTTDLMLALQCLLQVLHIKLSPNHVEEPVEV